MLTKKQKSLACVAGALLIAIPLWIGIVAPAMTALPRDFSYSADIISLDNLYDEKAQKFSGETRSVTKFTYAVAEDREGVLLVKNSFDVRKITGENIFEVERLYGIDPKTGRHRAGYGDRDRDGYLFAPRNLAKGQAFTYWHVNYDGPAQLTFVGEETIFGLRVYQYETRYEGIVIDQTKNLPLLPGVGQTRGVRLEPYLQVWIEPVSGHLVKYKDDTVAYYVDLATGKRLHPWNRFTNAYAAESVRHHVELALREKASVIFFERFIPAMLTLTGCVFLLVGTMSLFHRKRRRLLLGGLAACLLLGILIAHAAIKIDENAVPADPGPLQKIRIGVESGLLPSAVWIAESQGYFHENGIELEITSFPSGRAALTSMLSTDVLDMATVAQPPLVLNSFTRDDFSIIAGMVTSANDLKVLARRDRKITKPADLRGKTVGITKNSTGHYFLALFLSQYGLDLESVKLVDMEASSLPQALADGKVDAVSTWEPNAFKAKKLLGENVVQLESEGRFREDFYFVAFSQWAKENAELLKKFLLAVDKANMFIADNPGESQKIIAGALKLDTSFVSSVWKDYSYKLFLDQSVLLALEQQARWMVEDKIVQGRRPPNYLNFIFFDALEAAKPDSITIIR
ncbi:MAG: ABC transporter substrate-binding protein [Candidatus Peribacteraceae bacterium]|nr:ABC transporter substrate-binding protein [Candidatus Peribacteraceae bacterium]